MCRMNAPLAHPQASPSTTPLSRPRARRVITLRRLIFWLFGGFVINVGVAITIAGCVDPTTGFVSSASATDVEDHWNVTRFDRPGVTLIVSESETGSARSWSSRQVLGPPNTPQPGDVGTAWASSTTDGQVEWLELTYATAVVPRSVKVYESYNPGALFKVVAYRQSDGAPVTAWEGKDPTPVTATIAVGVSEVPLAADFPVQKVRIYLDSAKVPGWNEIDAVGLVDRNGDVQWAAHCKASSVYGQTAPPATEEAWAAPRKLLPTYGDLRDPSLDGTTHVMAGYGWPMISMWESAVAPPGSTPLGITPVTSSYPPVTITSSLPMSTYTPVTPPPSPAVLPTKLGVPHHAAWPGITVNTLVFAPLVALLHFLVVVPRRFITEVARVRRGACIRCGYDLGYDFRAGCPECGWRREANTPV
jgi:hypothetical protein